MKEKQFVNVENVITSYPLKSDVIQTHLELPECVIFVIATLQYVMNFVLF